MVHAVTTYPWRAIRIVAAIVFVVACALALSEVAPPVGVLCMIVAGCAWAFSTNTINRNRVLEMYALLTRIGDGELGASIPDSTDELTLRMQRGIARAQRGYAEALARAEVERNELQTLLGAIQTGLLSLDGQLRIRSANQVAEQMLDLTTRQYRGRLLAEMIRQPELLRFADEALHASVPTTREIRLSGGSVESIFVAADPLRDANGPTGLLLALDDLTRVRRLENVRTDFAANVSHELRTPITNIKGYLETLIQVGVADAEQAAHFLAVMHRNTIRLSTLVEDILLLAFLDQPRAVSQIDFAQSDVLSVARDAIEQLEFVAAAKEMSIELRIAPDLQFVVNSGLMSQAVLNLVSNALKYSPPKTIVLITAELSNEQIGIRVSDQGPGIDPLHLPRLFERFYRVDAARSRELGGTGLGLAIVKHIAMIHGGVVAVECPIGGGTDFFLRIPRGYRAVHPI